MNTRTILTTLFLFSLTLAPAFSIQGNPARLDVNAEAAAAPHPLLSDVHIRQAVAYCTDRSALIDTVYPDISLAEKNALLIDTYLPKEYWAYSPPQDTYPFNPAQGVQLLEDAGWTLLPGATYRTNAAGYELALGLTTTTALFRQTWTSALESQLRDNCGIRLVRFHVPGNVLFGNDTGLARRDFESTVFAWVYQSSPDAIGTYGCGYVPAPENGWSGQNYTGWCNPAADQALQHIKDAWARSEMIAQSAIVQDEFAADMVSLPAFRRTEIYAADARLAQFFPNPSEPFYLWNTHLWTIPGESTLKIGSMQEPASLWPLVESSYIASLVASAVYGQGATTFNYDLQAQLYAAIPTVENGGILTQTVPVSQGDTVLNAAGKVVALQPGVQVRDVHGQLVTYTVGTLDMVQISFTTHYKNGMKWPDGSALSQADLQLWDAVNCDPSAQPLSLVDCERTAGRIYLGDTGVRYTMLPGYRNIFHPLMPGAYPADRLLSDGRQLKDVPPGEWINLPEIGETPYGLGPYFVETWQKGQYIRLARNLHYGLGQPYTPYLEFVFSDDLSLQDMLAARTIHVLDSATLAGIGDTLRQAINAGLVEAYNLPSSVWEHVDFNLDQFSQLTALPMNAAGGVLTNTLGMTVQAPAGAFTQTVTLVLNNTYLPAQPLPGSLPQLSFSLQALDAAGQPVASLAVPLTVTIDYTDQQLAAAGVPEADLNLAFWDGNAWQPLLPCAGCSHDLAANRLTAVLTHLSEFSLSATQRVYLPLLQR
jgi:ABC-type transport system substrate-binding protein